ncbi:hypothetical protein G7046_g9938 [Stylonectria norvegica]|nr:hypothetical protein G7046_g9938 [Stylonectria norvegica]
MLGRATTSEPSTAAIIFSSLSSLARSIASVHWARYLSWLVHLLSLPWKLVLIPLRFVARVLLVVLAPALYMGAYFLSWIRAAWGFAASLEPLYTFFGAAAAVGIVAGVVLGVSSSVITFNLGMQGEEAPETKRRYVDDGHGRTDSSSTELDWQWLDSSSSQRRGRWGYCHRRFTRRTTTSPSINGKG